MYIAKIEKISEERKTMYIDKTGKNRKQEEVTFQDDEYDFDEKSISDNESSEDERIFNPTSKKHT